MPAPRAAPTAAELKSIIRSHEELERKLYAVLISGEMTAKQNIFEELWDYAEGMSGCTPEGDDDELGFYFDD